MSKPVKLLLVTVRLGLIIFLSGIGTIFTTAVAIVLSHFLSRNYRQMSPGSLMAWDEAHPYFGSFIVGTALLSPLFFAWLLAHFMTKWRWWQKGLLGVLTVFFYIFLLRLMLILSGFGGID